MSAGAPEFRAAPTFPSAVVAATSADQADAKVAPPICWLLAAAATTPTALAAGFDSRCCERKRSWCAAALSLSKRLLGST
eukprot:CAMPEP_0115562118 /NCGR_PEP_ID=MMETSP0271-20121206/101336_1 /TAXON_ID=71861 /ORGANISM="Scrippsiella trochoidea, Strain CCMP3099" /LENGTH=79 /DNA_ID=CAMNT_0002996249 /DNA_START=26 /DNA_END=261 /DNA_ORIENTATION=+